LDYEGISMKISMKNRMKNRLKNRIKKRIWSFCILLMLGAAACGSSREEPALSAFLVNGEEVSLREWNFYLRMNQMQWEKEYLEEYGDGMWDEKAGEDGKTLQELLREETFETIVRNVILGQQAKALGLELKEEEEAELKEEAKGFMKAYNQALLNYAEADETFVYGQLRRIALGSLAAEELAVDYEPDWDEEQIRRKGICYVLVSTTGVRDEEGNLTPYSEEEVAWRTEVVQKLCEDARRSGSLKEEAEKLEMTPIEATVGEDNAGDSQEPLMLDAARALEVGEISDPVKTDEGWFLVQLLNDYDEEGTQAWKEYLLQQEKSKYSDTLYEKLRAEAEIVTDEQVMDRIVVKKPLKDLL